MILPFSESLAVVRIGDRHVFINLDGEEVIAATLENAGPFAEGMAPVKRLGEWYFIGGQGGVVSKVGQVKYLGPFPYRLAHFVVNGKTGYLDQGFPFCEGFAEVKVGKLVGFIDLNGSWAVPPRL